MSKFGPYRSPFQQMILLRSRSYRQVEQLTPPTSDYLSHSRLLSIHLDLDMAAAKHLLADKAAPSQWLR